MFVAYEDMHANRLAGLYRFEGHYQLLPEHNHFETGAPPQAGSYEIKALTEGRLSFHANWVTSDGREQQMIYSVRPDGKEYPNDNPVIADHMITTLEDPYTLVTVKKKSGYTVSLARIELSRDESWLKLIQSGFTWNGKAFKNIALFLRK
ncbi:hypothetical protein XYCOK13_24190 [Xylanibacillus composti]|uniref:Uncharacterized protein n=1 Tax=Xylanibacillus composti TaxID=1572762 RepID=A0A8J4H4Q2_9BACL|nr:hypothetical protein XYCOK13_24190 [Xylanibacillus composti]